MEQKHFRGNLKLAVVALALPLLVEAGQKICRTGPPTPESYTWNFREEASQLLEGTRSRAYQVQMEADLMESFTRQPSISWQTHSNSLSQVSEQINDIGEDLCRMHIIRRVTDPWQQETIDRITPEVVALANNTEAAIEFLKENRANLTHPAYKDYVASLYEGASSLRNHADISFEFAGASPQHLEKESQLIAANYCGF